MSAGAFLDHDAAADRLGGRELLATYRAETGSLFASARGTLLTDGVAERLAAGDRRDLAARVDALLDGGGPRAVAIGALPFDLDGPARLHRPERAWRGGVLGRAGAAARQVPRDGAWRLAPVTEPAAYAVAVDHAVAQLRAGVAEKVVLARALDVVGEHEVDVRALVGRLAGHDPHAYTFAIGVGDEGSPRTLLGASPELLVARRGDVVSAHPLAGSAARSADPAVDRARAQRLARSEKDLHEHALVVAAVRDALAPHCRVLDVPAEPSVVATRAMWHLGTRITGRLADPRTTALDLALALHPTPAVCGTPTAAAERMIAELEPFDRGLYAGAVGWQDATGDGEWAVAIRCAIASGRSLRLFAGAGVVAASRGEDELAETSAKLATLLSVLGLEDER